VIDAIRSAIGQMVCDHFAYADGAATGERERAAQVLPPLHLTRFSVHRARMKDRRAAR
jgi:hypothetical protein